MLQFSYNFTPIGLKPEIICIFPILDRCSEEYDIDFILTSGIDRHHMRASLHYAGMAVDFSWVDYDRLEGAAIAAKLATRLGSAYDVIAEADHIHIEFQPKTPIA